MVSVIIWLRVHVSYDLCQSNYIFVVARGFVDISSMPFAYKGIWAGVLAGRPHITALIAFCPIVVSSFRLSHGPSSLHSQPPYFSGHAVVPSGKIV